MAFQWVSVRTSMMLSPFVRAAPVNRQTAQLRKSWALIELHNVIAWSGIRHHSLPGPHFLTPSTLTFKLTV